MALMGHGTFKCILKLSVSNVFCFNYLINRIQKRVSKNYSKKLKKTRQSSKADILDFKLECAKTFLMKFCWHGSNLMRKFQVVLQYVFRESDKKTPLPPLRSLKMKD